MHESEKWKGSRSVVTRLCDPMDCSLPCCSVHGIFQARVMEWGAVAFSIYELTYFQSPGLLPVIVFCSKHENVTALLQDVIIPRSHFFFFLQSFQVLVGSCFAHIWVIVLYWEYHSWKWKWVPAICRSIVNYLNQGLDSSVYPAPVYFLFLVFPLNRKNRQVRPHLPPPPSPSFSLSYN